jgi:type III secretion protein L
VLEIKQLSLDDLPGSPGVRILRAAEVDAWRDGYRFLTAAWETAEQIEASARQAYVAELKRGRDEGLASGEKEAARLVSEAVVKVDRYLASIEEDIAHLSLGVVRSVLGEFDAAEVVAHAAARALADFRRGKSLKITVHPEVNERARSILEELVRDTGLAFTIEVESDPRVGPRSCIIASEFAVVDASIDTQLTAIENAVRAGRPGINQ